jgi:glycosyltransferase involved in cell wall biosynthesis
MLISLCIIAKNEEKFLEKCLDSVKETVDEIIIVDTGSTDKTKEIAGKFNAKTYDFEWCDDFSKARNFSLQKATKDWILILDADETIAKKDLGKIKKLIQDKDILGYKFITRNYTNNASISEFIPADKSYEESEKYAGWFPSLKIRLFQNKKSINFEGIVHELVEPSIEKLNGKVKIVDIPIHHFGDSDQSAYKRKREFYLSLCEEKVKQSPQDIDALFGLGLVYKELEKYEDAINTFKNLVKINDRFAPAYL